MTAADSAQPHGFVRTPEGRHDRSLTTTQSLSVVAAGSETGNALGAFEETVAPGGGPPLHIHTAADEFFYVLCGEFTFQIGDERVNGGAGTVAFAPRGATHTWMSSGRAPGRMLFVFAPAGVEQFLTELSAVPPESLTMELANQMAAPYHTTFVGPPLAASG